MANTTPNVAEQRAQATRDEQMRRTLIGLIDVQQSERKSFRPARRIGQIAFLLGVALAVGIYVFQIASTLTLWYQAGRPQPAPGASLGGLGIYAFLIVTVGPFLFFPSGYMRASIDAILHAAHEGNERLAPLAASQPTAIPLVDLSTADQQFSPLSRWHERQVTNTREWGAMGAIFAGIVIIVVGVFTALVPFALVLGGDDSIPIVQIAVSLGAGGLAIAGIGVWACVSGWRAFPRISAMRADLTLTANADGLAWSDAAWRTRARMQLAWRDVWSFSVATYQREPGGIKWQVYIVDGGATRLLWALPYDPSVAQSAVHNRLAGVIVGATGLPLRDITPGLDALGVAFRSVNPLIQTKIEKARAATQPSFSGVPVRVMRRWVYGIYAVSVATLAVTLMYEALTFIPLFVH